MHKAAFIHILQRSAIGFGVLALLCGLILRSMIPMGYMPDPEAWRQGQITMTICTADGTPVSLRLEDLLDIPKHHPDQPGHATCPCCFIHDEALALLPLLALVPTAATWHSYAVQRQAKTGLASAHGVRGPPLGARAPPIL